MLAKLKTSLLSPAHARQLRLEPYVEGHTLPIEPRMAGFKIPYFKLDGKPDAEFFRFRYLQTKPTSGWRSITEEPEKPRRYAQPAGSQCGVYMPPLLGEFTWQHVAQHPEVPIVITEGELKAACGCVLGQATLGLGGVYNWRSAKHHQDFLPILEEFDWRERPVTICFDSDIGTNHMVRAAAGALAYALALRGAVVKCATVPPTEGGGKQGLDDYAYALNGKGAVAFENMLARAEPLGPGAELVALNSLVAMIHNTTEVVELATGTVYSASAFSEAAYRNHTYTEWKNDKPTTKYAAKEWLGWRYRNEVTSVVYEPETDLLITPAGAYNSWKISGWACQPSKQGSIAPWEELMQRMFSQATREHQLWVRQWFAYPIQHPGAKLGTALLIWGRQQGTGKTMLGETMRYIYGTNYGTVNNFQLTGQFTEWAVNKQFIVGDEIALGNKRHTANVLKDMITRSLLTINIKNRKSYAVRDCINYYFTSNHDDAVYVEPTDRRVFVHNVDTDPLRPEEYQAYQRWLKGEGAGRLFYYLLEEVDCAKFDPQGRAPFTLAKSEMAMAGRGETEDWAAQLKANVDEVLPPNKYPYDLYRTIDLLKVFDPDGKELTRSVGLSRALSAAGVFKVARGNNQLLIEGMRTRLWAVRNAHLYTRCGPAEAGRMYQQERERNPVGVAASKKFTAKVN